nr:nucleotide-binding domain containing protein [Frigoribacterium endophyticum]
MAVAVSRAWGAGLPAPVPVVVDRVGHVVVVVSSLHDASRTQCEHLLRSAPESGGAPRPVVRTVAPTLDEVRSGDLAPALARSWSAADSAAAEVTVLLAPPRDSPSPASPDVPGGPTDAQRIAEALAVLTDGLVDERGGVDEVALVLVGGEGARAVLRRAGAEALVVRGALREGVPWGTLEGGRLHGTAVVTKAGGFGAAATITEVVTDLLDIPHRSDTEEGDPS